MKEIDVTRDIRILIRSHYGVIFIDSDETERIHKFVVNLSEEMHTQLFNWTVGKGLYEQEHQKTIYQTTDMRRALEHINCLPARNIYLMQNAMPYLSDNLVTSRLYELAKSFSNSPGVIICTGLDPQIPSVLAPYSARMSLPDPTIDEYRQLLKSVYSEVTNIVDVKIEMTQDQLNLLINNLKGMNLEEAKRILSKIMIEDGTLDADDIQKVIEAKKSLVEEAGVLEYFTVAERFGDIADLRGLKAWLNKRKRFILEPEAAQAAGLTFPKGILLLGVPGTGKSLSAKAVALEWGLPLIRLDASRIFDKYIGETEKRFKLALQTAEKMAPLVLWIDEIEKVFVSGGDSDGGVSVRVMGSFLSWLQEREGDVFVVATANDISNIPPELLRKGRFDEIFFVDLPDVHTRSEIFRIHLKKRGYDAANFDCDELATLADGFSGAEIEQVIVSGLYTAFSAGQNLTDAHLLEEIDNTSPLSKTRAEHIAALRQWAQGRTALAN